MQHDCHGLMSLPSGKKAQPGTLGLNQPYVVKPHEEGVGRTEAPLETVVGLTVEAIKEPLVAVNGVPAEEIDAILVRVEEDILLVL